MGTRNFALLSSLFLMAPAAFGKQPCISNLAPGQSGVTMQTFRGHSAKLGGVSGQPECATNGKDKELKALKAYLKDLNVIGMPGFNNENPPHNYMASLKRFVEANGGHFAPIATHSDRIIEVDAKKKCGQFRIGNGQKVVLIGHSKGGATALYMWKECPDLMNRLDAVILVQSVIQGTNAADLAVNANGATKQAAEWIHKYELLATAVGPIAGGASMTTDAARRRLDDLAKEKKKGRGVNKNKVICVRGKASGEQLDARHFNSFYTQKVFGSVENDGLVEFENQHSGEVCGLDVQMNGVHHKALIERDSVNPADNDAREAFAAFLLNTARKVSGK